MPTKIEWTTETWNPVRGCSPITAGCENCYAARMAHRFSGPGWPYEGLTKLTAHGPKWTGEVRCVPELLDQPLRWRKPRRVFVNSMSDLFHEKVPDVFIRRVFLTMAAADKHVFQVLTKRPERMAKFVGMIQDERVRFDISHPLPNVHLLVSCENQEAADVRIPLLVQTPAAVRGVSLEPLLGPVELGASLHGQWIDEGKENWDRIHWVIVGGESGPRARPMNEDWVRRIRDDCQAAGVPLFYKQRVVHGMKMSMPELDGRVWAEHPA
jgi:protein gp37